MAERRLAEGPGNGEATVPDQPAGSLIGALRKHAPVIVTLLLFALGLYALHHLLAPLDFDEVLASIRATPPQTYLLAIGATAVGYTALIGYDWTATHYIGKELPLPSVALGGFLGYAFGNTIGLSALSGGAVRYRIYTALGLDGYDVAVISGYVAVAYGLGATLIGLGALALHPGALQGFSSIPPETLRPMAVAAVVLMGGTIGWLSIRRAELRLGRFVLRAPEWHDLLWQVGFCLMDITAASFALYVLLPSQGIDFPAFVAVFAVATMIGVASHVPGGVGVFETVIIAALGPSVDVNAAVTGLLLFRLIYFLLPFLVAMVLLSLSEFLMARERGGVLFTRLAPVLRAGQSVIPLATGMLVLGSGLFMMFSGLLRNPVLTADKYENVLPLVMMEGGALLSSIVGSALVVLAHGIFRRSRAAFWMVLVAFGFGIFAALLHGNDTERAFILAAMALLLLPCRREFYRAAQLTQGVLTPQWALLIAGIVGSITVTYFISRHSAPYADGMWWQFTLEDGGPRALRATLTASILLMLALLFAAMRTRTTPSYGPGPRALAAAQTIIEAHGTAHDLVAVSGDKRLMFSEDGEAVLAYAVRGGSWIARGAPVGPEEARDSLAWSFHDAARAAGAEPVFYEAPEAFTPQSAQMGLALHRMAEEAIVPLLGFSLEAPGRAALWKSYRQGMDEGLTVEFLPPPRADALIATLRRISDAWLSARGSRERRFSVGRFDETYIRRFPIAVARRSGEIVAFANLLTAQRTASVDILRHEPGAPAGTADFLLISILVEMSRRGYFEFSLGTAPLSDLSSRPRGDLWARFAGLIYRRGGGVVEYKAERAAKARFHPEWRPRYLCCRSVLAPTGALADAAFLIAGSERGMDLE